MIMIVNLIPYILAIMIFYDFSNHLLELIFGREKARKLFKLYWPTFKDRKRYTYFWTTYWGIAFLLTMIYLLNL